ncbi:amidohydrolase family protein [Pseudonocardia sp. CA-107938]|uniref:amidohydrolase n=1 Tax=Pseudonocardia sp. CA-107938 TaxID=3240021 RepID=UPI003D94563C
MLITNVRNGPGGLLVDVEVAGGVIAAIRPAGTGSGFDADGGTILPGLRDAHVHIGQWAAARQKVQLDGAHSAAEAVAQVSAAAGPGTGLVSGAGFRDALWPDQPHKDLLEAALPGRPVALSSQDLHTLWLSPAALALIGVDHPTGVLVEDECYRATAALPGPDTATVDRWAREALAAAATRGVTAVDDFEFADTVVDWTRRAAQGPLATRVRCVIARHLLDTAIARGHRTGQVLDDPQLTVGPLKLFVDGSLNTRTAWCCTPYPGTDSRGHLALPLPELTELVAKGAAHGITPAVHAIGDAAATVALDAFAAVGTPGRIEHAQLLDPADVARFVELGVTASVQPAHQPDDRDVADRWWAGRTGRAFPYADLHAAGVPLAFGSDAPVAPLDPWDGIASAVTRTDDERPPWHPEQALPLAAAVAASCDGRTELAVGDVADLAVVAGDLTTSTDLRATEVLLTAVAGRVTHQV